MYLPLGVSISKVTASDGLVPVDTSAQARAAVARNGSMLGAGMFEYKVLTERHEGLAGASPSVAAPSVAAVPRG